MTLAVGFFDGVHLGHQAILAGAEAVLTFKNHPLTVLAPERAPKLMMTLKERLEALKALGVAQVTALDFTSELATMSCGTFAAKYLCCGSAPMLVRCGANWHFGQGGQGNAEWLQHHGVPVKVVPYAEYEGEPISSSRIRAALGRGETAAVAAMLGRPIVLRGKSAAGKGEGHALGFPTVNLEPNSPLADLLPHGVYAVEVYGGVRAIANLGLAPTFAARAWEKPMLEVHFPGRAQVPSTWDQSTVKLIRFVRPERKFASIEELRAQIANDCQAAAQ